MAAWHAEREANDLSQRDLSVLAAQSLECECDLAALQREHDELVSAYTLASKSHLPALARVRKMLDTSIARHRDLESETRQSIQARDAQQRILSSTRVRLELHSHKQLGHTKDAEEIVRMLRDSDISIADLEEHELTPRGLPWQQERDRACSLITEQLQLFTATEQADLTSRMDKLLALAPTTHDDSEAQWWSDLHPSLRGAIVHMEEESEGAITISPEDWHRYTHAPGLLQATARRMASRGSLLMPRLITMCKSLHIPDTLAPYLHQTILAAARADPLYASAALSDGANYLRGARPSTHDVIALCDALEAKPDGQSPRAITGILPYLCGLATLAAAIAYSVWTKGPLITTTAAAAVAVITALMFNKNRNTPRAGTIKAMLKIMPNRPADSAAVYPVAEYRIASEQPGPRNERFPTAARAHAAPTPTPGRKGALALKRAPAQADPSPPSVSHAAQNRLASYGPASSYTSAPNEPSPMVSYPPGGHLPPTAAQAIEVRPGWLKGNSQDWAAVKPQVTDATGGVKTTVDSSAPPPNRALAPAHQASLESKPSPTVGASLSGRHHRPTAGPALIPAQATQVRQAHGGGTPQ